MIQYFPIVTGSLTVLGNINVSGSITTSGSITISGSITSASFATSASNATNAISASYANNLTVAGTLTAQTIVVQTVTSSVIYSSGSNVFGNDIANTQTFTGSLNVTGSVNIVGLNTIGSNSDVAGGGFGTTILSNSQTVVAGAVIGTYQGAYAFIDLATQASVGSWIDFSSGSGDDYQGRIRYNNGTQQMNFYTSASGTPLFNIGGSNVGIGTTTPSQKLNVVGNARFEATSGNRYVDIASSGSSIQIGTDGTTQFIYGSGGAFPLVLSTNGEEKMRIASNGLVSINNKITSSTYKLGVSGSAYINGSNGKGIFISDQATYATIVGLNSAISAYNGLELRASGTDYQLYLNTDGRVFINSNAASAYFDGKVNSYGEGTVPGACFKNAGNSQFTCAMWNAATAGDNPWITFVTEASPSVRGGIDYNRAGGVVRYNTSSDANLKNIIGYSDKQKSVDILNSTKIREFSWKEDKTNKSQIGVIAQELYETFKGAVSVGSDKSLLGTEDYKNWAVDKTAFTFHLIAGWQKHEQIIQELNTKFEEYKATHP
jgi:hypothetical protein